MTAPSSPALPFPVLPDASQAEAFTFGMEKVPATCELSLTVALQRMTPGIFAGDLAMFPSPEGKYVRLTDAQSALLAQAAEKDAEIDRLRAAINDHNTDCVVQCAARKDAGPSHCPMKGYRRNCSDCPRDGMLDIDASRALAKQEAKS